MQVVSILAHGQIQAEPPEPLTEPAHVEEPDPWLRAETPIGTLTSVVHVPLTNEEQDKPSGIYIGEEVDYDSVPIMWDPTNTRVVQNPHLMIMGESGSGKTYAQQCLVAELAKIGIPSIIFDYGQSFEHEILEAPFLRYFHPQQHLIGEEGLALNPLQIFPRDIRGPYSVATRLADVFDAAFRLGDIQKKVLIDAILATYEKAGITPEDVASWQTPPPTISALSEEIENLAADRSHYAHHKNAAGLSARLTTFFMLASFRNDLPEWSWDQLTTNSENRVHVLQFRGLEGKTQRVLVEVLLWHFFFHFKTQGQQPLRLFCVLDEAHHLSFRESGPLTSLLRESRKFGLGIIFASQQPEDFSPVAYSNSASKLILQTTDPSLRVSKFLTAKSMTHHNPERVRDIISRLPRGDAFFVSGNRSHVVHIEDFAKRSTLWLAE